MHASIGQKDVYWGRKRMGTPPPAPTLSEATGDSFPMDQKLQDENSRAIKGDGWTLPRPYMSHPASAHESSLQVKGGVTSRDAFYPWTFSVESILAKRRMCTQKRILRYSRYGLWMGQIEMTGLRKTRRNAPSKWFKMPRGNNAGLLPLSLPFYLSTCTVFFLLIHTSLASLLSLFVGILFCKAEGPEPLSLATALVTGIWCFLHYNRAGNPSPTQAVAGWGHLRLI